MLFQSIISGALDEDNYVAMASLDLSAAFDIVNVANFGKQLDYASLFENNSVFSN